MAASAHHLHLLRSGTDDESTAWLSSIIEEVWPYAANIAQATLMEYVQPALEANVPRPLPKPRFSKIGLGKDPVVVERVRVFERKYDDKDVAPVVEADIVYDGNPEIELKLGEWTLGVKNAKIRGRVEILLRPLLNRIPLVGATQVGFVNRPTIDYTLTGVGSIANQASLKSAIRSVINDVLASVAVLPNRVACKLAPEIDFFSFVAKPVGVLRVAALCGKGFPNTDKHSVRHMMGGSDLPDVYLTLRHGSAVHRTKYIDDKADPVWENQVFDFVLTTESSSQQLQIEAYDYDLASADDFLGRATILVSDLIKSGAAQIDLEGSPENAKPTVKLAARWVSVSSQLRSIQNAIIDQRNDRLRPKTCSYLLLSVEIDEASHLPPGKRPFVRVKVGDHRFQTNAAYEMPGVFSVKDPDFEQAFHIPLDGAIDAGARIVYQVLDLFSGLMMGFAYSSLADAVKAGPAGKIYDFALLQSADPRASLRVRVRLAAVVDKPPLWEILSKEIQV